MPLLSCGKSVFNGASLVGVASSQCEMDCSGSYSSSCSDRLLRGLVGDDVRLSAGSSVDNPVEISSDDDECAASDSVAVCWGSDVSVDSSGYLRFDLAGPLPCPHQTFVDEARKYTTGPFSSVDRRDVLFRLPGLDFLKEDARSFVPRSFISDVPVSIYMGMLQAKYNSVESLFSGGRRCWCLDPMFGSLLLKYDHRKLSRWSVKRNMRLRLYDPSFVPDPPICVPVRIVLPVNWKQHSHWGLFVVDFETKLFCYYDSLDMYVEKEEISFVLDKVKMYVRDELALFGGVGNYQFEGWSFYFPDSLSVPQQDAGSNDCAVFVCLFAEKVCAGAPVRFAHFDSAHCRLMLLSNLLARRIP